MVTKVKPWPTGGNVTLTYGGQGNSPVVIESDDNPTDEARSMVVTIETTVGSPVRTATFTVSQAACPLNFKSADSKFIKTADNYYMSVAEPSN